MTTSRMGIMGSLRVSNFSLFWVTDSPFVLSGWTDPTPHYTRFKNITRGKDCWPRWAVPIHNTRKINGFEGARSKVHGDPGGFRFAFAWRHPLRVGGTMCVVLLNRTVTSPNKTACLVRQAVGLNSATASRLSPCAAEKRLCARPFLS